MRFGVRKGKKENGPARRDWHERGFGKFASTLNSNEFYSNLKLKHTTIRNKKMQAT
jgi:hypothetical protein